MLDEAAAELVAAWDEDIDRSATPQSASAHDLTGHGATSQNAAPLGALPSGAAARSAASQGPPARRAGNAGPAAHPPVSAHNGPDRSSAPRTSRGSWLGVAVVAAAALAALGWYLGRDTATGTSAANATTELTQTRPPEHAAPPAAPAAAAPPPAAEAEGPESAPTPVGLTVRTIPRDAELRVDGEDVSNPYTRLYPGPREVRIVATAEGHEVAERDIELSEDITLMVTLVPLDEPQAEPAKGRSVKRRAARARARKERARKARKRRARDKQSGRGGGAGFVSSNPYQ